MQQKFIIKHRRDWDRHAFVEHPQFKDEAGKVQQQVGSKSKHKIRQRRGVEQLGTREGRPDSRMSFCKRSCLQEAIVMELWK